MHRLALHQHLGMQQAALLKAVIRHVFMLVHDHGPTGQHGVAVLSMARHGIGTVNRFIPFRRQKVGLGLVWPAREIRLFTTMTLTHLLQANDVCVQLLHGVAQVVDFQPSVRTEPLHTLVDVVGGNSKRGHAFRGFPQNGEA